MFFGFRFSFSVFFMKKKLLFCWGTLLMFMGTETNTNVRLFRFAIQNIIIGHIIWPVSQTANYFSSVEEALCYASHVLSTYNHLNDQWSTLSAYLNLNLSINFYLFLRCCLPISPLNCMPLLAYIIKHKRPYGHTLFSFTLSLSLFLCLSFSISR